MDDRVVDTSVVAALVFQEDKAAEAASLITDVRLCVPKLFAYELANVCRRKIQQAPSLKDSLLEGLGLGLAMNILWVDIDLRNVVELAIRHELTAYDASYLWAGRALDVPLITFDDRLKHAAQS